MKVIKENLNAAEKRSLSVRGLSTSLNSLPQIRSSEKEGKIPPTRIENVKQMEQRLTWGSTRQVGNDKRGLIVVEGGEEEEEEEEEEDRGMFKIVQRKREREREREREWVCVCMCGRVRVKKQGWEKKKS